MDILDELLGLDIVHAVHTRNTVTRHPLSAPAIFCDGRDGCHSSFGWRTRRKAHVRSRQDRPLPEHHGSSARGWRRPRSGRPLRRRHICGRRCCRGVWLRGPENSLTLGSAGELVGNQRGALNPCSELQCCANGAMNRVRKLRAMARWIAGAIAAGGDGLTEEICALADTAARRLDWRMARENIVMTSRGY